ncbi:hypothetical protein T06_114 [Trichinella sp. T6]|nr:hypothetical protein T06_114 [Trichinella sp. T6]
MRMLNSHLTQSLIRQAVSMGGGITFSQTVKKVHGKKKTDYYCTKALNHKLCVMAFQTRKSSTR